MPLEDLMQSLEAISLAYAQALIVNQEELDAARQSNDVTHAQEILQDAYRTDLRPLTREASRRAGGAINPLGLYRAADIRKQLIAERGMKTVATGL